MDAVAPPLLARRDRFASRVWFVAIAVVAGPIALHDAMGGQLFALGVVASGTVGALVFVWASRNPAWRTAGTNIALLLAYLPMAALFAETGGLHNPSSAWLLLPPLCGAALLSPRWAWAWGAAGGAVTVAMGVGPELDWDLGTAPETMRDPGHMTASRIGVLAVAMLLVYWSSRALQRSVERMASALAVESRMRGLEQFHQQVLSAANRASSVREAAEACIEKICTIGDWEIARVSWLARSGGVAGAAALYRFTAPGSTLSAIEGPPAELTQRVATQRAAVWIDTATESGREAIWYREHGVRTVLATPVRVSSDDTMLVEMLSSSPKEREPWRLTFIDSLTDQIGYVFARLHAEARFRKLALHDPLTGLPNRSTSSDRLRRLITAAKRREQLAAVIFLDIDEFKRVNDTLGHNAGDELLCAVARRLEAVVRQSDVTGRPGPDSISRLGGDEFTVLATVRDAQEAALIASRILSEMRPPFAVGDQAVALSLSAGIALFPGDGTTPEAVMRNADIAMYGAKNRGRNNFQFYRSELNESAVERLAIEANLRRALDRNELTAHFQPIRTARDGSLCSVEALARWHDGSRWIAPDEFVPIAMSAGLASELDERILRIACSQLAEWRRRGLRPPRVAVNMCASTLLAGRVGDAIREITESTGRSPHDLQIEISERARLPITRE